MSRTETVQPAPLTFETGRVYTLTPWRGEWLQEKLSGIAKRAERSGVRCTPRLVSVSDPYSVWKGVRGALDALAPDCTADHEGCRPGHCFMHWREEIVQDFCADGAMPVLPGGWRLLAAIDRVRLAPDQPLATIVREAPGRTCPPEFRGDDAANRCDHCNTCRARRVVYVLQDLDGLRTIQVGSTCVAEFIRDPKVEATIEAILAACAAWASVPTEDEDGNPLGGGRNDDAPSPLHTYLQHVAAAQRDNHGCYVSRAAAREMQTSTSDAAYSSMTARTPKERQAWPDLRKPVDTIVATAAIEWAKSLPTNGSSFEQNLRTFAWAGFYTPRHKGTAAYIVPAYLKSISVAAVAASQKTATRFAGEIGSKHECEVEVIRVSSYESQFGTGYITTMRVCGGANEGATLKWMSGQTPTVRDAHEMGYVQELLDAGSDIADRLTHPVTTSAKAGDRLTIAFKVKGHGQYKGAPETQVSHVKRTCNGWGYRAEPATPAARIATRMLAEGQNAPAPVKKTRVRKAKTAA